MNEQAIPHRPVFDFHFMPRCASPCQARRLAQVWSEYQTDVFNSGAHMKVYLAGKVRGVPDYNRPLFAKYADQLRRNGYEVFNPTAANLDERGWSDRQIMRYLTDWIYDEADAIALMPGWETSKGARAELAAAQAIGLEIMWLE